MVPLSKSQISQLFQQAQSHLRSGELNAARIGFEKVSKAAPKAAEPLYNLARIARMEGDISTAVDLLARAHALKPEEAAILTLLAECQAMLGEVSDASKTYDRVIALQPKTPKPLADKALFLQQQGQFDDADALFRKAMKCAPDNPEIYRIWLGSKTLAKGDPVIRKMQRLFAHPRLNDRGKVHLGFALAKAMEDTAQYDKVFRYLNIANAAQRKLYPYDPSGREAEIAALMSRSETLGPPGESTHSPIIITGLPRSGTTLVEQILAAHDDVVAGGELAVALRLAYGMFGLPPHTADLAQLRTDQLAQFAQTYERQVAAQVVARGRRVTDKSIQNHLILGHLHRAMPNATLIVVKRDPRDVALSIYKNYFADGTHRYANNLVDIALYIKGFNRIVDFWKERVPVHEIAYDDLIEAPEAKARALVQAAGLPWQDQCLEFYKQGGAVKTLSLAQVRKPIYKSSGGAWQRYETEMQPFVKAWESL